MKFALFLGLLIPCLVGNLSADEKDWGKISGQLRAYSMIEDNQDPLMDYHVTALGGKILYTSPKIENLQGSIGIYTTNAIYSDVTNERLEPRASNRGSRYAAGLVDTTDLDNRDVTGVGEANIRFATPDSMFMIGRMKLDTPFINPQDGRMIPTLEQGVWGKHRFDPQWSAQFGYINGFWNRNTPEWKSVEESLGYGYEMGISPDGVKGNYYQNTSSKGIAIANVRFEKNLFSLDFWDYYVENIFNLLYYEAQNQLSFDDLKLNYAFQGIHEYEIGDGGNGEDNVAGASFDQKAKSYFAQGEKSFTYGAKIALVWDVNKLIFAYNRTNSQGRFLFPREWGKEPLYTFQKRERSDGSGDCDAWLVTFEHDFSNQGFSGLSMMTGYGEYDKSDPKEWRFNKYGTPSYAQWNIDFFYRFGGAFKGLRAEYLFARKVARGETYQEANYNYIFRKNGMNIHNFILNYDF